MTPQCTDCLGYHGQAKPCPAVKEIRLKDACEKCGSNWTTETQREAIREINRKTYERLTARLAEVEASEKAKDARISASVEAFHLEEAKVEKARDFILNQKCSCTGEGVGTPGGCDRCRALDHLSTFGWDFKSYTPSPSQPVKVAEEKNG